MLNSQPKKKEREKKGQLSNLMKILEITRVGGQRPREHVFYILAFGVCWLTVESSHLLSTNKSRSLQDTINQIKIR